MSRRNRRYVDSSTSSENSPPIIPTRRRLPSPPSGILREPRHVTILDPSSLTRRVDRIADNLEDTTRNLESMDTRIADYKDIHDDSMSALSKLKTDLEGSISKLRYEREKRAATRESRSLHHSDISSNRRPASSLGFERTARKVSGVGDHLSESVRDLRGRVDDLMSNQSRIENDLQYKADLGPRRALREVNGNSDLASDRVERRLKQLETEMATQRDTAVHHASESTRELLRRSQAKAQDDDVHLRTQLLQAEAGKRSVESDLDAMRRRLEQSEGGREALMGQIADLRNQIAKTEKSRADLESQVKEQVAAQQAWREKETEERRQLASSQRYQDDRRKQEEEISDLRAALKHSVGVVQLDDMRKNLEKSERQRQQLSDHIEVLTKDLEKKDQSQARLLTQLNETQRNLQDSERDRDKTSNQLEDALLKLQDYTRDAERYMNELKKVERLHCDSEKEKEELRTQAQETFRQWKAKCKKLEKENERFHDNLEQQISKNEELVKENQSTKSQMNTVYQQADALRKEMDDLIDKRADLEEKLQRRDAEIMKGDDEMKDMVRKLQELNLDKQGMEDELKQRNDRMVVMKEDICRAQEETNSSRCLYDTIKSQNTELQKQIRDLAVEKAELTSKLDAENTNKKTFQKRSDESEKQVEVMRLEINSLHKQLDLERETHKKECGALRTQVHQNESISADTIQKLNKKISEERDFLEQEIHRINVEANESKAARRDADRKLSRLQQELQSVMQRNIDLQSELEKLRGKYAAAKNNVEDKHETVTKSAAKLRIFEDDLAISNDKLRKLKKDIEDVQNAITHDVDDLASALHLDETAVLVKCHMLAESDPDDDIRSWLSSIRHRIGNIKNEINDKEREREKLCADLDCSKIQMKDACKSMEDDRRMLMAEATEQNKLLDALSREKTSLLLENREARRIVTELEDRVSNLTFDLETSKARTQDSLMHEQPTKLPVESVRPELKKESQKEREMIQKRYAKYKATIESLQNDIEGVCPPGDATDLNRSSASFRLGNSAPSPIRKVTIADTPPTVHGYGYSSFSRPMNSSPKYMPEKDNS